MDLPIFKSCISFTCSHLLFNECMKNLFDLLISIKIFLCAFIIHSDAFSGTDNYDDNYISNFICAESASGSQSKNSSIRIGGITITRGRNQATRKIPAVTIAATCIRA